MKSTLHSVSTYLHVVKRGGFYWADASVPIIELPKSVSVRACVCVSSVHVHWVSPLVTYVELAVTLWSGVSVLSAVIGTQGELYDYRSYI